MRIRSLVSLPLCLLAFAAVAQTATPAASQQDDSWNRPAAATSAATHERALHDKDAAAKPSPFKFKSERKTWMKEPPPPRANDQNAVMGTSRPWQDGRPPVSCAQTPQDPACR